MSELKIILGNKNYSSWSLRPWLALKHVGLPFEEVVIPLFREESKEELARYSPSGKVPVLCHGDIVIWESLAICEYLAETFPPANLWPRNAEARAVARAVSAEMHAGFSALRSTLPMNLRVQLPPQELPPAVRRDAARIEEIWLTCREDFGRGGEFLFGNFSIADCMYAPVVTRFTTYGVPIGKKGREYMDAVWAMPAMREWLEAAKQEPWLIEENER